MNNERKYYDQGWTDWVDGKSYEGGAKDYRTARAAKQLRADESEIAALRAENEALRTVTEQDAIRVLSHTGGTPDAARKALQSFIRGKEASRE